ncbi:hypothetical protein PtA15_17A119 [Puccinia triticina]|uniref:Uncharacterized protein n=1 Tax=Puccinia triticina TaxID=208348 RepID=A0ABY7DCG1_9BASI|nr:uncharacterized protein PtA15_17A119 [Puccinia triticina]WAQ92637.1 hypothetical protein PtA15_17A119 [Puccinia triticina]
MIRKKVAKSKLTSMVLTMLVVYLASKLAAIRTLNAFTKSFGAVQVFGELLRASRLPKWLFGPGLEAAES